MALWLYLHFPALQLDTLCYEEAKGQSEQAVIVVDGRANRVVQLNDAATHSGIKTGMGLGTASALQRDLGVVDYCAQGEEDRLLEIAQWLYAMASDLVLFPPDGLLIRAQSMLKLYRDLPGFWRAVQRQLRTLNISGANRIRYQYATGYTPFAARLLARAANNRLTGDKALLEEAVRQRNLQETELPDKTVEKLSRVGIQNVGDLLQIPLAELARRFDIDLVNYIGRLRGDLQHPLSFYHPPARFRRYLELLYEIENSSVLLNPLKRLFAQLEHFLMSRDWVVRSIQLRFHERDEAVCEIAIASAEGEYRAAQWLQLVELRLERVVLQQPVTGITLDAGEAEARHIDETDMFAGDQGGMTASQLVSLLQARLGSSRVKSLTLADDFRPERATRLCSISDSAGTYQTKDQAAGNGRAEDSESSPADLQVIRPSILLPKPRPLSDSVSLSVGPERIVTGWWDSAGTCRDYFIARNRSGQWLWVFRTLDNRWFIHGYFA